MICDACQNGASAEQAITLQEIATAAASELTMAMTMPMYQRMPP